MIDLNKITVSGVVGHVEQRQVMNNTRNVTAVTIYVGDDYKNQKDEWVQRSHRVTINFYGPRADGIFKIIKKGDVVWATGKIATSNKEVNGKQQYNVYFDGDEIGKMSRVSARNESGSSSDDADSSKPKSENRGNFQKPKSTWSQSRTNVQQTKSSEEMDDILNLFEE